jgi:hypothetical protein
VPNAEALLGDTGVKSMKGERDISRRTLVGDMVNYAVRTIQLSKMKGRFMRDGEVLEDDWEPFAVFYGQMEPWLVMRKKLN